MKKTIRQPHARGLFSSLRKVSTSSLRAAAFAGALACCGAAGTTASAQDLSPETLNLEADLLQIAGEGQGDQLLTWVDRALSTNKNRHLDIQVNTPWQILHGLLAMRENYELRNGQQMIRAMDWISNDARFKGESWFTKTADGGLAHPYNGTPYDFEGHVNQTLAIIAMCNVPREHKFKTESGEYVTMQEMIDYAKRHCSTKVETTWTLWFLTAYCDQDEEWTNIDGEPWSMEHLVKLQVNSRYERAPCGGCHSLFALAFARNSYLKKHGQLRGAWLEADQKLERYVAAARSMQNKDGSFATGFFNERGQSQDFNERIKSSGHMLEWLLLTLPQKRLEEQWLRQGVQTLASDLIRNAQQPADCGPLYHSIHALILYRQRTAPSNAPVQEQIAKAPAAEAQPQPVNGPVVLREPDGESRPDHPRESVPKLAETPKLPQAKIAERPVAPPVERLPQLRATPNQARGLTARPEQKLSPAAQPPVEISEVPESLKRLSGEQPAATPPVVEKPTVEKPTAKPADAPKPLAPVEGAMPILAPVEESGN